MFKQSWLRRTWARLTYRWRLRKALKEHKAYVKELRNTWTCVQTSKIKCVWADKEIAGYIVIGAYANELGGRKIKIVHDISGFTAKNTQVWAIYAEWAEMGKETTPPMREVV